MRLFAANSKKELQIFPDTTTFFAHSEENYQPIGSILISLQQN
jgi:hypothetical protein